MYAEDFVINCSSDGKIVEKVSELLPNDDGSSVLSFTLYHESVDLGCRPSLVVSPQQGQSMWEPQL